MDSIPQPAAPLQTQLVVFDFDWSFADQDTDRYIFEVLAPHLRVSLREGKKTAQWTDNVLVCFLCYTSCVAARRLSRLAPRLAAVTTS